MRFSLRRASGAPDLELTRAHELVVRPRRGKIVWERFARGDYPDALVLEAAEAWSARAVQEYHSLSLFTQLASQVHLLGAPLDWAGAFARMIADEVRHTELCARMAEALGAPATNIDAEELPLPVVGPSLRGHVRHAVIAAFCIGETLSGRMFRRCLRAATVPLAKQVVKA